MWKNFKHYILKPFNTWSLLPLCSSSINGVLGGVQVVPVLCRRNIHHQWSQGNIDWLNFTCKFWHFETSTPWNSKFAFKVIDNVDQWICKHKLKTGLFTISYGRDFWNFNELKQNYLFFCFQRAFIFLSTT